MSVVKVSAKLDRTDSQTPWGFRMAGGKDYSSPLIIQKVNPGSLSSKCGIKENDIITHIGGFDVINLTHKEAQDLIIGSGNSLELKLERTSDVSHTGDIHFSQPVKMPWQQQQKQPYKPNNEFIAFAPKPFQKPGTLPPMTSCIANLGTGDVSSSPKENIENVIDVNGNNLERDSTSADIITGRILFEEDAILPANEPSKLMTASNEEFINENVEKCQKQDNLKGSALKKKTMSCENEQLERLGGCNRIFEREEQPQSKSFKRLQSFLSEQSDAEDKRTDPLIQASCSVAQQNPANCKPQISTRPKIPAKPFHSVNRTNSIEKEPIQSSVNDRELTCHNSSRVSLPSSQPQVDSCYVKIIPPTMPKPLFKHYNCSYSNRTEHGLIKTEISSNSTHPSSDIKEVPSGNDVIINNPKRKTITVKKNNESHQPSSATLDASREEIVIQSEERKQIVIKPRSAATPQANSTCQIATVDVNGARNLICFGGQNWKDEVIYGPEKTKITLKKKSEEPCNEEKMDSQIGSALQDLGLGDGVVVGLSLPSHLKECLPCSDGPITEPGAQIKILPKPNQRQIGDYIDNSHSHQLPMHGSVHAWHPKIPIGERKMKIGKPGQAERRPPPVGSRIPICMSCHTSIRGPFITALDKTWCPEHFICANPNCAQPLFDCGFVEEADQLYCEKDYEKYLAPRCARCSGAIVGEVVLALGLSLHTECFFCHACKNPIPKYLYRFHSGDFYCLKDWGALFQTKCYGCQFPIEPGDRWVEALSQNWHSECFNCSTCQVNLEGQSFCAKNGKPYCKKHGAARRF